MKIATLTATLLCATVLMGSTALAQAGDAAMREANELQAELSKESGHAAYSPGHGTTFKPSDHVYIKSAIAIDFTYRKANVTLPLYRGVGPDGQDVYYVLTESSDFDVAKRLSINYAPKLAWAKGSAGVQPVTIDDGVIHFVGAVDFSPTYKVVPGEPPTYFPPKAANPGAVADAKWSSIVVLPSGQVLNAQVVKNATGTHDRLFKIDLRRRTVTM